MISTIKNNNNNNFNQASEGVAAIETRLSVLAKDEYGSYQRGGTKQVHNTHNHVFDVKSTFYITATLNLNIFRNCLVPNLSSSLVSKPFPLWVVFLTLCFHLSVISSTDLWLLWVVPDHLRPFISSPSPFDPWPISWSLALSSSGENYF